MKNVIQELIDRGFIDEQITNIEDIQNKVKEPISCYAGFDPTAKSLHIGSLMPIIGLMHFQKTGHRPIIVVGGATGKIGDPSGKTTERELLSNEQINENKEQIKLQLSKFLDFEKERALVLDNSDWIENCKLIDFLRDIGKYFTVNRMISHESVKTRMENREHGISYTEFSYMLLQAYDFLNLYDNYNCILQLGGSDQWGNIVEGISLIRRLRGKETYGITFPLLTTSDGRKFGKTESGTIWLDSNLTSPYRFYQYWINADDRDAIRFLYLFTFIEKEKIQELHNLLKICPEKREAQKALAFEVTKLVHGEKNAYDAKKASEILFAGTADVKDLEEGILTDIFSDVPSYEMNIEGQNVVDVAISSNMGKSKSEIRRKINEGGFYINNVKISSERSIGKEDLIHGKYLLLRKGKKDYVFIKHTW